ncbi:MAG: hypothetical protein KDB00_26560 [Planctomycetales bacterium]|nr:hypothetical protein [Planctomycetales bacterium]
MRILSLAIIGTICVVMIPCAQTADTNDSTVKTVVTLGTPATLAPRPKAKVLTANDPTQSKNAEAQRRLATKPIQIVRGKHKVVHQSAAESDRLVSGKTARRIEFKKPTSETQNLSEVMPPVHDGAIQLAGGLVDSAATVIELAGAEVPIESDRESFPNVHDVAELSPPSPLRRVATTPNFVPLAAIPMMPEGWNQSENDQPTASDVQHRPIQAEAIKQTDESGEIEGHRVAGIVLPAPSVPTPLVEPIGSMPIPLASVADTNGAGNVAERTDPTRPLNTIVANPTGPRPATGIGTSASFDNSSDITPPANESVHRPRRGLAAKPRLEIAGKTPELMQPAAVSIAEPQPFSPQPRSPMTASGDRVSKSTVNNASSLHIQAPPPVATPPMGNFGGRSMALSAAPAIPVYASPRTNEIRVSHSEIPPTLAVHQSPINGERQQNIQPVTHRQVATTSTVPETHLTDLVVGTIQPSSRRVAQVAAQVETDSESESPFDGNLSAPLPIENPIAIPIKTVPATDRASIKKQGDLVTLVATDADIRDILRMIAEYHKLNLVIGPEVAGLVTVSIRGARLEEVLDAILGVAGFQWHQSSNLLYVTSADSEVVLDPKVQGRRLQVYALNYVSARDMEPVVNRLLSPIGKVFATEADAVDQLRTRELLIVEDNDASHERIAQYIAQVDIPPSQVLVEAHVLQIDLSDEERHGVNLRAIARVSGAKVTLEGTNFADENPEGPSMAFRIAGTDVGHLIEAIHINTNSRTLASPKVSVVNRQTAKVQIGQRLPYAVSTTTQTATIQNVQFLDVGIVLEVTPVITQDGNILMTVLPKVSGGKITESGFPEEDTTQVSTTVLMPDGSGLVIGGLIRENDSDTTAVVPKLGKIPVIKHLFNKRATENRRNELVVALVTHIVDGANPVRQKECIDLQNALPDHAASELHFAPEIRYSTR